MTGAARHLVSHSGYGSLIVPGVLLKRDSRKLLPPRKESPLQGARRGAKNPISGRGRPPSRPHLPGSASTPLCPQRGGRGRTFTCQLRHPPRPAGRPSGSQHSSKAGCGSKNPKGIPSQRKKAKRLFLQAEGHQARRFQEATRYPCPAPTR